MCINVFKLPYKQSMKTNGRKGAPYMARHIKLGLVGEREHLKKQYPFEIHNGKI